MKWFTVFFGLLLASANVSAKDGQDTLDWLKVVAFAAHQTDYTGVFVYHYDDRVETSRITHVVEADGEHERLEGLDGPRREVIRYRDQVWCYIDQKMVRVNNHAEHGRFPSLLPERLSALRGNYHVREAGVERVAGYSTQAILFQPKDNLRYAHKVWVHTDSGLLLKAAVLGDKNRQVEQYAFTQLQIGGNIDRSWIGSHLSYKPSASDQVDTDVPATNSGWVVDAMPAGFRKTAEVLRTMHGKRVKVTQLVYSDGLSAISVFIEPSNSEDEDNVRGLSSRGAMNLYYRVVGGNLITVVGEVPPRTVMQVLDSLRYNGK